MPQLPQRLGLNLPDAFASNREALANFFAGVLAAVLRPKPPFQIALTSFFH
jgi:hypothetical protein